MKVSLVIPFLDQYDVLLPTIKAACEHGAYGFELVLIDNGSVEKRDLDADVLVTNEENVGVLQTFKQGYYASHGDIILFIHSDVMIHSTDWAQQLEKAFEVDPKLGLGGFFGARAIGENGGRADSMSNMVGKVWGKCTCHPVAGEHHGNIVKEVSPATVLDGLGMAFRRETLKRMIEETDAFADWRSPHHFYDKILSLKVIDLGYHVAVIPVEFDHFSGATAVRGDTYKISLRPWLKAHNVPFELGQEDQAIYDLAEKQMFDEYGSSFPITVDAGYNYYKRGAPYAAA